MSLYVPPEEMTEAEQVCFDAGWATPLQALDLRTALAAVLARDSEWALSGMPNDCGCIRLSRQAEREYETGKCPHQLARAALERCTPQARTERVTDTGEQP